MFFLVSYSFVKDNIIAMNSNAIALPFAILYALSFPFIFARNANTPSTAATINIIAIAAMLPILVLLMGFGFWLYFFDFLFEFWFSFWSFSFYSACFFCFIAAYFFPTLSNSIFFSHFFLFKWSFVTFWRNMNIALLFSGVAGYGEEKGGENRDFVHSCNIGNFGGFK